MKTNTNLIEVKLIDSNNAIITVLQDYITVSFCDEAEGSHPNDYSIALKEAAKALHYL